MRIEDEPLRQGWALRGSADTSSDSSFDRFEGLGSGRCINQEGSYPQGPLEPWSALLDELGPNGSSQECASRCAEMKACKGYETLSSNRSCRLLQSEGFSPSSSDDAEGIWCHWRHQFKQDSPDAYKHPHAIPKIIWSFWSQDSTASAIARVKDRWYDKGTSVMVHHLMNTGLDLVDFLLGHPQEPLPTRWPPFINLCVTTWRKLNPDWEIRVLNYTTVWDWLARSDLPREYDDLDIAHQSDAIRLALLWRYGGIWIDASTLMLRPADEIIGSDPTQRYFVTTNHMDEGKHERRVNRNYFIENWFFAAPPGDVMLGRAKECYSNFFSKDAFPISFWGIRSLDDTGLFSQRQMDEARTVGLNSYFLMYACLFKAIDEDASLWRWWNSPDVHMADSFDFGFAPFSQGWSDDAWFPRLLRVKDDGLVKTLLNSSSKLIKFPAAQRDVVVGLSAKELITKGSTLYEVLNDQVFDGAIEDQDLTNL